jgi:hypothetical protein
MVKVFLALNDIVILPGIVVTRSTTHTISRCFKHRSVCVESSIDTVVKNEQCE